MMELILGAIVIISVLGFMLYMSMRSMFKAREIAKRSREQAAATRKAQDEINAQIAKENKAHDSNEKAINSRNYFSH